MSLKKQWRIVQLLLNKSEAGELDWKQALQDDTFQLSFQSYTLLLREEVNDQFDKDYSITLLNEQGNVADTFNDVQLFEEFGESIKNSELTPYQAMKRLYDQARRHALGTDRILDTILGDLGDPF